MTQKEIFIIKAIWGTDSQGLKKEAIKKDIKNVDKHLIVKKQSLNRKLKSELS